MSGDFALSPGRMSTPFSPPLSAAARLSRRNWLFGLPGPWQLMQDASKIGLMSRAKSTCTAAGGGSLLTSTAAAHEECAARSSAATIHARASFVLEMYCFTAPLLPRQYNNWRLLFDPCTAVWQPEVVHVPNFKYAVCSVKPMKTRPVGAPGPGFCAWHLRQRL